MSDPIADELAKGYSQLKLQNGARTTAEQPPRPDPYQETIRAHHHARDITANFARACQGLEVGQLVKDENFSLFEAVQALEVMDPKMDSGCLDEGETLDEEYDVSSPVSPSEVISIIDQILCYEAAWHQGYPLAQTLFTSLYIIDLLTQKRMPNVFPKFTTRHTDGAEYEDLDYLEPVLRAYCIGVIKSCDIILEMITTQTYYEEEDFTTQTYQKDLLTDMSDQQCAELIGTACSWLRDRRKDKYTEALIVRLEARKALIDSFVQADPDNDSPVKRWSAQKERYQAIRASHDLGTPLKDAFGSKMHRKLATTAPPRPSIDLSFDVALDDLTRMCDDLMEASFVGIYERNASPESIRSYLWSYSSRSPTPATFPRAALQALLLAEGRPAGAGGIDTLILNELRESVIPIDFILDGSFWEVEVPSDPRYEVARKIDWFFERAAQPYANVFRALCQNRCRIRRCLTNILAEFDDLSGEMIKAFANVPGHRVDESVSEGAYHAPLDPSKIRDHNALIENALLLVTRLLTLRIIQWIIQLGFEHDIYQPHELSDMYRIVSMAGAMAADILQSTISVVVDYQKDPSVPTAQKPALADKEKILVARHSRLSAQAGLARGLSQFYEFLSRQKLLPLPNRPYTSHTLQYQLRTRPFLQLAYPPMPLPRDANALAEGLVDSDLLLTADKHLEEACKSMQSLLKRQTHARALGIEGVELAWRTDVKGVLRAAVGARLALKRVKDWWENDQRSSSKHKIDIRVKASHRDVDEDAKGMWLAWPVPEVIAVDKKT